MCRGEIHSSTTLFDVFKPLVTEASQKGTETLRATVLATIERLMAQHSDWMGDLEEGNQQTAFKLKQNEQQINALRQSTKEHRATILRLKADLAEEKGTIEMLARKVSLFRHLSDRVLPPALCMVCHTKHNPVNTHECQELEENPEHQHHYAEPILVHCIKMWCLCTWIQAQCWQIPAATKKLDKALQMPVNSSGTPASLEDRVSAMFCLYNGLVSPSTARVVHHWMATKVMADPDMAQYVTTTDGLLKFAAGVGVVGYLKCGQWIKIDPNKYERVLTGIRFIVTSDEVDDAIAAGVVDIVRFKYAMLNSFAVLASLTGNPDNSLKIIREIQDIFGIVPKTPLRVAREIAFDLSEKALALSAEIRGSYYGPEGRGFIQCLQCMKPLTTETIGVSSSVGDCCKTCQGQHDLGKAWESESRKRKRPKTSDSEGSAAVTSPRILPNWVTTERHAQDHAETSSSNPGPVDVINVDSGSEENGSDDEDEN